MRTMPDDFQACWEAFFVGQLLGPVFWGRLADLQGRRTAILHLGSPKWELRTQAVLQYGALRLVPARNLSSDMRFRGGHRPSAEPMAVDHGP